MMTEIKTIDAIPNAKIGQIIRMIEALSILGNESDRPGIAFAMGVKEGSVNAPILGGVVLGLVELADKTIKVAESGLEFLNSGVEQRKSMVGQFLSNHEPFATILRALDTGPIAKEELLRYVKGKMPAARAWKESTEEEMLGVIRNWCEFGNLIEFDEESNKYRRV